MLAEMTLAPNLSIFELDILIDVKTLKPAEISLEIGPKLGGLKVPSDMSSRFIQNSSCFDSISSNPSSS